MKKHIWMTVLAAALVLAACNSDEQKLSDNENDTPNEEQLTGKDEEQNTTEEKPAEASVEEIVIYGGDANFENIEATSTVDYSYATDGNITEFLIEQLGLSSYYNSHTVSGDEQTITLDFNESIATSQQVQGSAGAYIFSESLAVTFFKNIPDLQTLQVRIDGKEQPLDHTNIFTGTVTREAVQSEHPELVK